MFVSGQTGEGVGELWAAILSAAAALGAASALAEVTARE